MVNFRQLLITILIAATLVARGAFAQTNLTQILDTVTNPNGTLFNGTVVITWNGYSAAGSGTVSTLSTSARIYNGALSVLLVPTTTASPGTYYEAVYTSSNGLTSWTETWQVPPSTTALTLAQVRQTSTEGSGGGTSGGGSTSGSGSTNYATLPIAISSVTGLAADLNAINTSLGTLQTSNISLLNTVSGLSGTVTGLNSTVTGLSNSLSNLTSTVSSLSATVSSLGSSNSSSVAFVDAETPSGTINGANSAFTLANTPSPGMSLSLYLNGLEMTQGVDYTFSGAAITFLSASMPQTGDVLTAFYRIAASGPAANFSDGETPGGIINGTNVTFTLASTPNPAASLRLYRNGLLVEPGVEYTLSGSTITFTSARTPQAGDQLSAFYRF